MDRKHHYLVSGEVMFRDSRDEEVAGMLKLNSIITSTKDSVSAHQIGRSQQALQLRFRDKVQDPEIIIYDVFIISISYLGNMTDEEFQAPLEGIAEASNVTLEAVPSPFK